MSAVSHVRLLPNGGWDQRILLFQYSDVVTAFAVRSDRYVILIDTLVNPSAARVMLDAIRDQLHHRHLLVINTHADWDHCWGNSVFAGVDAELRAPIIGHLVCRERLQGADARHTLAQKQYDDPQTFADVKIEPPTVAFADRCTINGGDLTFKLIHTPGHTGDHLAVYIPEIATLFPGDAAELPLPFVDTAATLPQLRGSLITLQALQAQTVLYCHAPGEYYPSVIDANIAYFDTLEAQCRSALATGRVPAELGSDVDVEALVGYDLGHVGGAAALGPEATAFYRGAHQQAIRVMLEYLQMVA